MREIGRLNSLAHLQGTFSQKDQSDVVSVGRFSVLFVPNYSRNVHQLFLSEPSDGLSVFGARQNRYGVGRVAFPVADFAVEIVGAAQNPFARDDDPAPLDTSPGASRRT